jgi:hypothetical protein
MNGIVRTPDDVDILINDMQAMTVQYTMPYGLTLPFLQAKGLITLKTGSV